MLVTIISFLSFFFVFVSSVPGYAAVFNVASGDVAGLIAAINAANSNGEENTINLEAGTYTLTAIDNGTLGSSGLPIITSVMTISGAGTETTVIERDANAPRFGILSVTAAGTLTLQRLALRGADRPGDGGGIRNSGMLTLIDLTLTGNRASLGGGGINNDGTLTLIDCILTGNSAGIFFGGGGGGIFNSGTATISHSTFDDNGTSSLEFGGGGLLNFFGGTVTIADSTFVRNSTSVSASGGGLQNVDGTVTITDTTFAQNSAAISGGGLSNVRGLVRLRNTTFAENTVRLSTGSGGAGVVNGGDLEMENTILARNEFVGFPGPPFPPTPDCRGRVTSLGHNLIGGLTGCTITLQPSDLTGDPGLGEFIDDGAPGNGRFPLLPGSPAIDAGNDAACSATDQLDTPRLGACDIGAIEFYPIVNDLVAVGDVSTDFDATPVPGGPAGTFRITAEFTNTSNQAIVNPFVEVVELTGENLLLNADGGAGGVGARLKPTDNDTTLFQPGEGSTFEFLIGLQQREPFTFFVNMLGESLTNPSIRTMRVEAVIDGRSQLILRNNTAQWRHFDFAAPGRLDFKNAPTVINNVEWFPVWPDKPDKENRDCDGCLSDVFTGVNPPLLSEKMIISLRKVQARNKVSIVQLPTAANNLTLIIEFDDNPPPGDEKYIVNVDFVTDRQNGIEAVVARQR